MCSIISMNLRVDLRKEIFLRRIHIFEIKDARESRYTSIPAGAARNRKREPTRRCVIVLLGRIYSATCKSPADQRNVIRERCVFVVQHSSFVSASWRNDAAIKVNVNIQQTSRAFLSSCARMHKRKFELWSKETFGDIR